MVRRPAAGRSLTAQPDPAARRGTLVEAGFYGPASEAWQLNREAMLLLGAGPRALLLQIAHPLVAAGVAEHSNFREDPWARLAGTLRSYLRIVYGTSEEARSEIRRLAELHRGVRGEVREPAARRRHGARYAARDPELGLWVHATLVDSTIVAYDTWIEPLSAARRRRFYDETVPVGRALGIPASLLPPDLDAFEAYVDRTLEPGGPIEVGDVARDLASVILNPPLRPALAPLGPPATILGPLLDAIPPRAYGWLLWPAIGLLPPSIRDAYGLQWGLRERAVSAWLVATWAAWRPLISTNLRQMPQALRADRRVGAGPSARPALEH
ncbi:MAG: DUF2236 domain-containing protein [Chloroflexi bacterium]|nr:DUF2236 domain-containing protein [Chloroflexota bacterium]